MNISCLSVLLVFFQAEDGIRVDLVTGVQTCALPISLSPDGIRVHEGEMFGRNASTGKTLALSEVELLAPCAPSKIVALWNNFHALAAKIGRASCRERV